MVKKPTLSLCMIVKDEEKFLKKCLNSIKPIVDEIVVVDTGSKDKTIEIANSFGAKVIKHKWNNNFSKVRNISLKHAKKDWILVLDADETISKKDLKSIKAMIGSEEYDAYTFIQRNYVKDREITTFEVSSEGDNYKESKPYKGWFPSELVRLFRNNKGYHYTSLIHELVEQSIKSKKGRIKPTQILIHHFRADKDEPTKQEIKEKYLWMGEQQIKLTPDNPKPYYEVGTIYTHDERYNKAIELFEKAIELIETSDHPEEYNRTYFYLYFGLGKAYIKEKRYLDSIRCFEKVLQIQPKSSHVTHFFLAQAYTMLNRFGEAIGAYNKAATLNPNDHEIHNNLANIYSRMGQFDSAVREFKMALSLAPGNATIHRNLGATYLGMKKYARACDSFKKAIELEPSFEADLGDAIRRLEKIRDQTLDVDYSFSIG